MPAGRPRKPTAKHSLEGTRPGATTRHDRDGEPESPPLVSPPERLKNRRKKSDPQFLDAWHYVVSIAPPGVLRMSDAITVELAAHIYARMTATDPLFWPPASEISTLNSLLSKMGMTPADRSRVAIPDGGKPKKKEADPWAKLGPGGNA